MNQKGSLLLSDTFTKKVCIYLIYILIGKLQDQNLRNLTLIYHLRDTK